MMGLPVLDQSTTNAAESGGSSTTAFPPAHVTASGSNAPGGTLTPAPTLASRPLTTMQGRVLPIEVPRRDVEADEVLDVVGEGCDACVEGLEHRRAVEGDEGGEKHRGGRG